MNQFKLINIEYNSVNGFVFEILHIETWKQWIGASLLGLNFGKGFFYLDLFYCQIKIFDKTP